MCPLAQSTGLLSHTKCVPDREFAHSASFAATQQCLQFLITFTINASLFINIASIRRILINHSHRLSVVLSVCLSVRKMYCGKTTEWIQMLFGMMSGVTRGMGVLDGVADCRRGRRCPKFTPSFGGQFRAPHCNQWGLLHSCAEVHEPIKLLFAVGSVVGRSICVLGGG